MGGPEKSQLVTAAVKPVEAEILQHKQCAPQQPKAAARRIEPPRTKIEQAVLPDAVIDTKQNIQPDKSNQQIARVHDEIGSGIARLIACWAAQPLQQH